MATRTSESNGTAELNKAVEIGRVESIGPVILVVSNQGNANVVVAASKLSDSSVVTTDKDTEVAAEGTGYTGNAVLLDFTGQALNNTPIVPGSVLVEPAAGGDTVNATDKDCDGILYTVDTDEDACGTIDYFTGDMVLGYPAGKAPNSGAITADYNYQDELITADGKRNFEIANVLNGETIIVRAACDDAGGSFVKCTGIATWV